MKQVHPNSQFIADCISNQNSKLLKNIKAKHNFWLEVLKNFCASILIIVCTASAVIMAKSCTSKSQNVGGAK